MVPRVSVAPPFPWKDGCMATRTITTLVDDLDGSDIPRGLGETVRFGIDGENYEIGRASCRERVSIAV